MSVFAIEDIEGEVEDSNKVVSEEHYQINELPESERGNQQESVSVTVADTLEKAIKKDVPLTNEGAEDSAKDIDNCISEDKGKAIGEYGISENYVYSCEVLTEETLDSTVEAEEEIYEVGEHSDKNIEIENKTFEDIIDDNVPMTTNSLLFRSQDWKNKASKADGANEEIMYDEVSENLRKKSAVANVKTDKSVGKGISTTYKKIDLNLDLPEFDPDKFTPGYVPKTVVKGDEEYMIVVEGVQDTGLCGKYWGDVTKLSNRRRRRSTALDTLNTTKETTHASVANKRGFVGSQGNTTGGKIPKVKGISVTPLPQSQSRSSNRRVKTVNSNHYGNNNEPGDIERIQKRKLKTGTPDQKTTKGKKKEPRTEEEDHKSSDLDTSSTETIPANESNKQHNPINTTPAAGQQRSVSCIADTRTQREVMVECFAPYEDLKWVDVGKEGEGMAPNSVLYSRTLRPPYHLQSFLRIKGHSVKGRSWTDKNTMVFVVVEGEIVVIIHATQFNVKKGDSFYIPPKNFYNLINQNSRDAELSLIQFQYDGHLPSILPN